MKVLVLGAGGLGCEILKNLALVGVPEVHVVDMDTIELTNLNRQFLFRDRDIGQAKAEVAAKAVNAKNVPSRVDGKPVNVVAYHQDLTQFSDQFLKQFTIVVSGLDAIEPRRWINSKLHELAFTSHFETVIPLIDGASEGFMGHCKLIVPGFTSCYECSLSTLPADNVGYPLCTIASNPRNLAHCIQYVSLIIWPKNFDRAYDLDDERDLVWICQRAGERAQSYHIQDQELTPRYTLGILKSIIPSVTTTNTIIAGQCSQMVQDLLEDVTDVETCPTFTMYNGESGAVLYSYRHEREPNCLVCSQIAP